MLPGRSVSSGDYFGAKLVFGDFYGAVEFVAECSSETTD